MENHINLAKRFGATLLATAVLAWTLGWLFLLPVERIKGGVRTDFGFVGWTSLPGHTTVAGLLNQGVGVINPVRLVVTLVIAIGIIAFAVYFLKRTFEYFQWELMSKGCPVCGYSLDGAQVRIECPECGWGMPRR